MPERARHIAVAPGILPEVRRIDLQLDQLPHGVERVAEEKARALEGAEQVADHRKAAALDAGEEQRRPARLVDAPLDLGRFEVRIDLVVDAHELAGPFEIGDTCTQAGVTHESIRFGTA